MTARLLDAARSRHSRRMLVDRLGRQVITLGGMAIIASILAIFFVIAAEVYPMFQKPTAQVVGTLYVQGMPAPLAMGVDEYREVAYLVTPRGVEFISLDDGKPLPVTGSAELHGTRAVTSSRPKSNAFALGLPDGRIVPVTVKFEISYPQGKRLVTPQLTVEEPITISGEGRAVTRVAYARGEHGPLFAAVAGGRQLVLVTVKETQSLIGPSTREQVRQELSVPTRGEVTALAIDGRGDDLFLGTSDGEIIRVDLREPEQPTVRDTVRTAGHPNASVTLIGFLLGDRTLVVGDAAGNVSSWQLIRREAGSFQLAKIHDFEPHQQPIVSFSPSQRDKGFITADSSGTIKVRYGTTGKTLLTNRSAPDLKAVTYAPKGDGLLSANASGTVSHWTLKNPHPETTWQTLFGKVWYEGYKEPAYVWQSHGGTDDFESKFSLTPLIFGTLKGTLYALLFAVPLALLGALYTSQFMHPSVKNIVKPTVEIMAALPSVVLGFLAGLWLAPRLEAVVPGVFLLPVTIPLLILLAIAAWRFVPATLRNRVRAGTELILLIPLVLAGVWLAFYLGGVVEESLLSGDYRTWLRQTLGLTYDQRNSLVVGFAMGFAIIPIIFTIADDSLSNVPQHLVSGSLALGVTRWQTALRLVLPTASPGIFSAIMIGFGRAVGETMIVLMATGNTPVMEWSIFNGFRAMSANIAVELPEAPVGGSHYRVLFLAALLLFVMTFIVNTAAEIVRLRLRKRYQTL